jgi:hypothetical protein
MKIVVWTLASLLVTFIASSDGGRSVALPESSAGEHFPSVKASNLEKRDFNLPADFEGERNLLLVAFEREQQKDVDTWLREMKRFEEIDPGFHYYELPTIQRPNALMRWFIDPGMRRGIPDRKARERTIALYLEKKPFLDSLLITDQKKIYAFLVDREGKVLWRSEGVFDETKGASLRSALGEHRQRMATLPRLF